VRIVLVYGDFSPTVYNNVQAVINSVMLQFYV
jgi:hypothetical protein